MTTLAPTPTERRHRDHMISRLTGIGGILTVIWVFGSILSGRDPTDSSSKTEIARFFARHGVHYLRLQASLEGIGEVTMMLLFAGLIWHVFRADRKGILPWVVALGAVHFVALADSAYSAAYSFAWADGEFDGFQVDPGAYQVASGTQLAGLAHAQMGLGVAIAAAAYVFLRAGLGPRWLQYAGIVIGLSGLLVPAVSAFIPYFLLTNVLRFLWLGAIAVVALRGRLLLDAE